MMICATFYLTEIMTDLIRIVSKLFIGVHYEMLVKSEDGSIEWLLQNYDQHEVGEKIGMYVRPENIQIMHRPRSEAESARELDI